MQCTSDLNSARAFDFADIYVVGGRVRVVGVWQTKRESTAVTDRIAQPLLVDVVHVEGRICEHEIEAASQLMGIIVIAIDLAAVPDVALKAMHREIETAEATGIINLFDTGNVAAQPTVPREDANGGQESAAPAPSTQPSAGEHETRDLLGGKSAPTPNLRVELKSKPTDNELARWEQRIDELLSDGHPPAAIREANRDHVENLRRIDPHFYEGLTKKLGDR